MSTRRNRTSFRILSYLIPSHRVMETPNPNSNPPAAHPPIEIIKYQKPSSPPHTKDSSSHTPVFHLKPTQILLLQLENPKPLLPNPVLLHLDLHLLSRLLRRRGTLAIRVVPTPVGGLTLRLGGNLRPSSRISGGGGGGPILLSRGRDRGCIGRGRAEGFRMSLELGDALFDGAGGAVCCHAVVWSVQKDFRGGEGARG
ncbi:hypothetical protein BP00DRAFT_248810 [Aspergillus indologenus CBS 114.80]|uniref:Uncharacterized protein n=1 Tax=Aspergillus indologenus CBS 114.80 TaxID=1450541 RepID=A0A2V5HWP0_9EURO|nr:hypothetical protein BP00DRAFT_248810 [Aspergillus indologenus CBS 114.80]